MAPGEVTEAQFRQPPFQVVSLAPLAVLLSVKMNPWLPRIRAASYLIEFGAHCTTSPGSENAINISGEPGGHGGSLRGEISPQSAECHGKPGN